ncbi:MAG: hypothetical protein AB1477_09600 [Acidobacteriota bacterium]
MLNPVIVSIPIFALLIAIEALYARRRRPEFYNSRDAWTNIIVGFVSVGFNLLFGLFIGAI